MPDNVVFAGFIFLALSCLPSAARAAVRDQQMLTPLGSARYRPTITVRRRDQ